MSTSSNTIIAPAAILGFNGEVQGGLRLHPNEKQIIYPTGALLVIQDWMTGDQIILHGHTTTVSSLAISACGKFIASGQIIKPPYQKASVHIWDFESATQISKYDMHSSTVVQVIFSNDSREVYSLSGLDDHSLAMWEMESKSVKITKTLSKPLKSTGSMAMCTLKIYRSFIITSSEEGIKVWEKSESDYKLSCYPINLGKLKRQICCMMADDSDTFLYCGTTTGDVIKVRLNLNKGQPQPILEACIAKPPSIRGGPQTYGNYSHGVRAIVALDNKHLAIGAGDGTIEIVEEKPISAKARSLQTTPAFRLKRICKLRSKIKSLQKLNEELLIVGTKDGEIFSIQQTNFDNIELKHTCHCTIVHQLVLPSDTKLGMFVTIGEGTLRIWKISNCLRKIIEMYRIKVPGLTGKSAAITDDGSMIISAWNDGTVRAHGPESGELLFELTKVHRLGVSAVAVTKDKKRIISGGNEGHVQIWDYKNCKWNLTSVITEQRGTITSISMNSKETETATTCEDGTCFIWHTNPQQDIKCKQTLRVMTKLSAAIYVPGNDNLLITSGLDQRVICWNTQSGDNLHEMKLHSPITSLYITKFGHAFITGFQDGSIKVWNTRSGQILLTAEKHTTPVISVAMSEDCRMLLSAGEDGSIISWDCSELNCIDEFMQPSKNGSVKSVK